MNYDSIKYQRQTRVPEKEFWDYTLEEVPIHQTNVRKQYPMGTLAIIGIHRDSRKEKVQSILIPRTQEEIAKKVAKGDIFLKIATLEKNEINYCDNLRFQLKYDPNLRTEGLAEPYKNMISFGNKYIDLPYDQRSHVIRHEVGHMWETPLVDDPDYFWKLSDSGIFNIRDENSDGGFNGNFYTRNLHEAMAESFSYYIGLSSEKKFLKEKYPEAYKFIKQNIKGFTWLK